MASPSSDPRSGVGNRPRAAPVWRVERIYTDGRHELVTLAGEPWEGTEAQARRRAAVMQAEEPDVTLAPLQT